jgi:membrane associated rhomboid family serine protease
VLLPIGLDNARLSRWPVVSTAIVAICLLAWLGTALSGAQEAADRARRDVVGYLDEHPYLELPRALTRRLGIAPAGPDEEEPSPAGPSQAERAEEQQRLEELADAFVAAQEATPVRRFSVVPSRGLAQPGWITYQFMHGGLGHLLGNMLIFVLVVGPFLEDAWGPLFFAGFYLLGGVAAAAAQVPAMGPEVPLLGASGSISACLGAFALRFAHRRVRMLYWFFLLFRGQVMVPAWLYALLGFGADLLGLALSGGGGGVAYACHVGGFAFGLLVAVVVRAARLEERIAPEGAVRWRGGMDLNRAAEALAEGDVAGARARLGAAVARAPGDLEARLELARLEAGALDLAAATDALEPVLADRIGRGDTAGARALLSEFQGRLRADRLRPATAYRVAELCERDDLQLALALYQAVGTAGGPRGAKALGKAAQQVARAEPERARALLEQAEQLTGDAGVLAPIRALLAELRPPPGAEAHPGQPGAGALGRDEPAEVTWCRLVGVDGARLRLAVADGREGRVEPARVALVSSAQLERLVRNGSARAGAVVLDLLLRGRPGERRLVLRLAGHEMDLATHFPGVPPARAFAALVEGLLLEGNAAAAPDPTRVQGRPFARYPDLATYELACYGRTLPERGGG